MGIVREAGAACSAGGQPEALSAHSPTAHTSCAHDCSATGGPAWACWAQSTCSMVCGRRASLGKRPPVMSMLGVALCCGGCAALGDAAGDQALPWSLNSDT